MTVTASRTRSASPPTRSGWSGFMKFLIGVVLLAVLVVVGYAVLTGQIPGQAPQPAHSASANPPVLIGEDPTYQFLAGDDGAPRVRNCEPATVLTEKKCGDLKIMIIDAGRMPWIARNIQLAWTQGKPSLLHRESTERPRRYRESCGRFTKTYTTGSCDEFPFASSLEGGNYLPGGARVEEVDIAEQRCQGGTVETTYRYRPIDPGEEYLVIIAQPEKIPAEAWAGQPVEATQC